VYVLILDGGQRVRQLAREFVENTIDDAAGGSVAPPLPDPFEPPQHEACAGANTRIRSVRGLREVVVNLSAIGGRRKAILYFNGASDVDFEDCTPVRREYDEMVRTAVRNDVRIYPIDSRGFQIRFSDMTGNLPGGRHVSDHPPAPGQNIGFGGGMMVRTSSPGTMGASILADDTGGIAIANTNNFSGGFNRIVRDNSEYYVVSYYSSAPRDGAFHRVSVQVRNRPALEIGARSGYKAATPDQKGKAARPPKLLSPSARAVLAGTTTSTMIPHAVSRHPVPC
jgi:VWFA-related protein